MIDEEIIKKQIRKGSDDDLDNNGNDLNDFQLKRTPLKSLE